MATVRNPDKDINDFYKDNMHKDDPIVVIKLYDFKEPVAGRFRQFEDKGRWTKPIYVYIHRADGTILQKYTYGFEILTIVEI